MSLHLRTQHSINVAAKQKRKAVSAAKPGRKAVAKEAVVDPETGLVSNKATVEDPRAFLCRFGAG